MPKRKVYRTAEEEEEFKRLQRERKAENQRRYRENVVIRERNEQNYVQEIVEGTIHTQSETTSTNERQRNCRERKRTESVRIITNNSTEIQEHYNGPMDIICTHCNAKHFPDEKVQNKKNSFNDCCGHGEVVIEKLPEPPIEIKTLFEGNHPKSNEFFKNIRSYNSSLSFASFNANLVNFRGRSSGPFCFKIQGSIYYQINTTLKPILGENPSYGQLFIIDPNEATEIRSNVNVHLDPEILRSLDRVLRDVNIFCQAYEMMGEEIRNQERLASDSNDKIPQLQLLFTLKPGMDKNRYNFQRTNEVAAVFSTTADGEIPDSYVVVCNKETKVLQKVSTMDPNVEPWVYPLFYPFGTRGWDKDIMRTTDKRPRRVTRSAYIKFRLAIRNNEFNTFNLGRRLFQQWVVDNYVKIEKDRTEYCKSNQTKLRVETYQGLFDFMQNTANSVDGRIGKMIVLPSTFIGSPRYMMQNYQDSMAIVRKFGKPDLFITMTCNPKWREIIENLLPDQVASDRPDICARVFNIKKNSLINCIVKEKIFGDTIGHLYVIEFQKRGLPHAHILIILKQNHKLSTPIIIDRYISAEIPDNNIEPELHKIIMRHNIHGPCREGLCIVNGKCSKKFPKPFQEETVINERGQVHYQRKDTNTTFVRTGGYEIDNRYVVPYNPFLSKRYNCHINVEVVGGGIESVKYLHKYMYKGHDSAAINISETSNEESIVNHDEIKNFIDGRYVGPVEACWRILNKPLQEKSHSVMRLPVHLPNEQNIFIESTEENALQEVMDSAVDQVTMLLDYFALNSRDEEARKYSYTNIPSNYVFKKTKINGKNISKWQKRQRFQFKSIGRMYSVSPTQVELFHLRLLLLYVKGAQSYGDLRTVDGITYDTFTAACLALGLIEDDEEWKKAMNEAILWMMPSSLRKLFVRILIHCQPTNPKNLWEEFKNAMSEDFSRYGCQQEAYKRAYSEINTLICAEGRRMSDFPEMEQIINEVTEIISSEINSENMSKGQEQYNKLNEKQKEFVDIILQVANNNVKDDVNFNNCFYIDGPGESGKTFVYTTLYYLLKSKNKQVCTMAFTGIAATLLPKGKTVHKVFGLPVPLFYDLSSNIKLQSKEGIFLKECDVFIWDEAPMAPRYALEIMDKTLRDIERNNLPFGGKIVILGGDFRQLLPVKENGTRAECLNLSIKFSSLWKHFEKFTLSQNMRTLPQEIEFSAFLLNVGNGLLNDSEDCIQIPNQCIAPTETDIVIDTFGDLLQRNEYKLATKCAILSARNIDVQELNIKVVELLDATTEKIYTSVDSTENCNDNGAITEALLPEYLNTLSPTSLPPHELCLRKYSIIMLIRNLSINEGLCNGTRLLILDLGKHLLKCEILTGDKSGEVVFLNRITLYCENEYPFSFKRRQFPIKLAFAMTINKAQGQTFEKIAVDLRKDVFTHGQGYVAYSRVKSWETLKIFIGDRPNKK